MFDFDAGKLIVIGIVALVAIPSKDLPRVLRQLGQIMAKLRRTAAEFQDQFMEAMRESELQDVKKEFDAVKQGVRNSVDLGGSFDPMTEARKHITEAIEHKVEAAGPPPPPAPQSPEPHSPEPKLQDREAGA